ncbi:MAG: hypothetical protein WC474_07840 [Hydrogenophilaceae bacterium]
MLSRAYREASQAEPPKPLDDRILTAARAAVAPKRRGRSRWFAWAIPLSTAAVLVLAVTLNLYMPRQAPQLEGLPAETPSLAMNDSAPQAKAEAEHIASSAQRELTSGAAAARPGPARAEEAAAPAVVTPGATPFPAQQATRQATPTAESRNAAAAGSVAVEASPTFGAAAKAQTAAPESARETGMIEADHAAVSGPEERVREIRRLLREGRAEEARKALQGLRRQYPEYPLPDDLKKP